MCTKTIKRAVAQYFDASVQQQMVHSIFGKEPKVYFSTAQNSERGKGEKPHPRFHPWFKRLQTEVKDAIKERCTSIFALQTSQLQFPRSYKDLLPKIQALSKLFFDSNSIPCCRFRDEKDRDEDFGRIFFTLVDIKLN